MELAGPFSPHAQAPSPAVLPSAAVLPKPSSSEDTSPATAPAPALALAEERAGRAATAIQARYRGTAARNHVRSFFGFVPRMAGKALDATQAAVDKVVSAVVEVKEEAVEVVIEATNEAKQRAVGLGIKAGINGALSSDPWIPKELKTMIGNGVVLLVDDILERAKDSDIELRGKGSSELRAQIRADDEPTSWPLPPVLSKEGAYAWLRSRVLYALNPADRNLSYVLFRREDWWMLCVQCAFVAPFGLSTFAWLLLLAFLLPVPDEYQLFSYIASFKVYAFLLGGVLPVFADYLSFYLMLTMPNGALFAHDACARVAISTYQHAVSLLFLCNWFGCWVVFARYKYVRRRHHVDGAPRLVQTGDRDTGDWEPTLAMKYDVAVTCIVLAAMGIDYALRVARSGNDSADGAVLDGCAVLSRRLWWQFLVKVLSFTAAPFVLFKLPGLGPLVHGLRPTGFDQSGSLRLDMTIDHARRKFDAECAIYAKASHEPASTSTSLLGGVRLPPMAIPSLLSQRWGGGGTGNTTTERSEQEGASGSRSAWNQAQGSGRKHMV